MLAIGSSFGASPRDAHATKEKRKKVPARAARERDIALCRSKPRASRIYAISRAECVRSTRDPATSRDVDRAFSRLRKGAR
jgi:hypothetical protein